MKRTLITLALGLTVLTGCTSTSPKQLCPVEKASLTDVEYRFDYGSFQADVSFTDETVTWSADGYTETDAVKVRAVGEDEYFINWSEKDKTFVTLFVNLRDMKVYNCVLSRADEKEDVWFMEGSITKI